MEPKNIIENDEKSIKNNTSENIEIREEFILEEHFNAIQNTQFRIGAIKEIELDESNAPIKKNYTTEIVDAKSIGVVIYMDKSKYFDSPELNMDIHFPLRNEVFGLIVLLWVAKFNDTIVPLDMVVNHEHGKERKACHKQIFLEFKDKIRRVLRPSSFVFQGETFLIMAQAERKKGALKNYCKKIDPLSVGEVYFEFRFEDVDLRTYLHDIFSGERKVLRENGMLDVFHELAYNPDFKTDYKKIFTRVSKKQKELMVVKKKELFDFKDTVIDKEEEKVFSWHFPQFALKYMKENNNKLATIYSIVYDWFKTYCLNNDPLSHKLGTRKKALFFYGKRCKGKTRFFQSFVCSPDDDPAQCPFIVYCRTNITAKDFQTKEQTAQLIILDDIDYKEEKHKEMFKALMVGESTNIESKHVDNYKWTRSLPCVILTNEIEFLRKMIVRDIFASSCISVGTVEYIGPPGTEPKNDYVQPFLDDIVQQEFDNHKRAVEEWVAKKNNNK